MSIPLSAYDTALLRTMREMISENISSKSDEVASGIAKDMFDYGKRVGYISGLMDALSFMKFSAEKVMGDDGRGDK